MNFIQEVINIVSENEISDARLSSKKLIKEMNNFQNDVRTYIDENYNEFTGDLCKNKFYLEQSDHLMNEVNNLFENIEAETKNDLLTAAEDIQQYLIELKELQIGLRINNRILKIDELFAKLDLAKSNSEFSRLRDIINELRDLIYDKEDEEIFRQIECYKNISIHWHIEHELLLNTLQDRFDQLVQMSEKTFQNTKCITIKISRDFKALNEIIVILFDSSSKGQRMSKFLMENVFEPIITRPVSLEVSDSEDKDNKNRAQSPSTEQSSDFVKLTVSFSTKPLVTTADAISLRPNYKIVFKNIVKTFNCIKYLNVSVNENITVLGILAENIKETFCKLLKDECLSYAIPDTIDDMNSSTLISDLTEFNNYLTTAGFLSGEAAVDNKLFEFTDLIDVIFKKRFCLNILKNAVDLMRKDLHDMQVVDETVTGDSFPSCMVSRNTFELIDLMEKVLKEAVDSLNLYHDKNTVDDYVIDDLQNRLRSTIPMILERYLTEVIEAHGKLIQTIPQQTALFHNNCMYLAWWLGRVENQEGVSLSLERSDVISLELQELGSKHFALQIKNQRTQLIEILKEFDLSESINELGPQPLKVIRQCLRQLELLKNVWQTILPEIVYNKTMGTLLNDVCTEIIRKIMAREDISSAVAESLESILDNVVERAPTIFHDPLQVSVHVKQWVKLQQLKSILNASMVNISELWSDGKGPLTLNYKAEEIRHLIRALFQNTDRRANVLASIV